jgi:hypothetical protein
MFNLPGKAMLRRPATAMGVASILMLATAPAAFADVIFTYDYSPAESLKFGDGAGGAVGTTVSLTGSFTSDVTTGTVSGSLMATGTHGGIYELTGYNFGILDYTLDGTPGDVIGVEAGPINGSASTLGITGVGLTTATDPTNGSFHENGPITAELVLQVAAVPEPSTWAMMILGFCGIGFMAYRKKQNGPAFRMVA